MISFNIETLNSGANTSWGAFFIKLSVATATFKNQLKIAILKEQLKKRDSKKEDTSSELYTNVYLMWLCCMIRAKWHIDKYIVLQYSQLVHLKVLKQSWNT